jgi:2'-5' RNA ligase
MAQFFVGIIPPNEVACEVERWRREFRAPKTPAHLTLLAPFTLDQNQQDLLDSLAQVCAGHHRFLISCRGLGNFGKAVIFIDVRPTPELFALQQDLADFLKKRGVEPERRPYHPHITLATRLQPGRFALYKQQLIGYNPQYSFACEEITLFRLNIEGRLQRWQIAAALPLKE